MTDGMSECPVSKSNMPVALLRDYKYDSSSNKATIKELGQEVEISFDAYNIPAHIAERLCLFIDMGAFYESRHFVEFLTSAALLTQPINAKGFYDYLKLLDQHVFTGTDGVIYRIREGFLVSKVFEGHDVFYLLSSLTIENAKRLISTYNNMRTQLYSKSIGQYMPQRSNTPRDFEGDISELAQDYCNGMIQLGIQLDFSKILTGLLQEFNAGVENLREFYEGRRVTGESLSMVIAPADQKHARCSRGITISGEDGTVCLIDINGKRVPFLGWGICPHFLTPTAKISVES